MTECKNTVGPDFLLDDHGEPINPSLGVPGCIIQPDGETVCPDTPDDLTCKPFQLTNNRDNCFIDSVVNEALNIGGAVLNVYKLLGIHEQCKLVDVTGNGLATSNGDSPNFPAANAFDIFDTEWRSIQKGDGVIPSAFIGYDFGDIKTSDGSRNLYGIETRVRKHITAFAIKQSPNPGNRVTRARLERSEDGVSWYGAGIALLPDDDCLNTVLMKHSVASRYWRLRPLDFNGGLADYWGVKALQLFHNYEATHELNIQDKPFLENRDRSYDTETILLKGSYDLLDVQSELTRFGIELPTQTMYITVNFSACVAKLGRPVVIGDIIEIPSEVQYSAEMKKFEKYMEVTDVGWSTDGFTPGWQPTLLRIVAQKAFASQETQDIFGDLAENVVDDLGLMDSGDGNHHAVQDYSDVSDAISAEAGDAVPERGREVSGHIRAWEQEELESAADQGLYNLQKTGLNPSGLYAEDGMPPNNAPYTEGPTYPSTPDHEDYHRLTYEGLSKDVPARLYRYSASKNRWIFLEKDRRAEFNLLKPTLQEFLTVPTKVPHTNIFRDEDPDCPECTDCDEGGED